MAFKIYVGGLPYASTEEEVQQLFAEYGEVVSVNIIKDKFSGQSKGFGFVEMAEDSAGEEAIKQLDGKDFGGRTLRISKARPPEDRPPRRDGGGGGGYGGGGFNR